MMSVLTVFGLLVLTGAVYCDCPNGWTKFDDSCYRLYRNGTKWDLALFDCEKKDAYLATLDTQKKIDNIHALMKLLNGKAGDNVWIGMLDVKREGVWYWEYSSQNVSRFDWATGEPNQQKYQGEQDCVMLYGAKNFQWADDVCDSSFSYMCERPLSAN